MRQGLRRPNTTWVCWGEHRVGRAWKYCSRASCRRCVQQGRCECEQSCAAHPRAGETEVQERGAGKRGRSTGPSRAAMESHERLAAWVRKAGRRREAVASRHGWIGAKRSAVIALQSTKRRCSGAKQQAQTLRKSVDLHASAPCVESKQLLSPPQFLHASYPWPLPPERGSNTSAHPTFAARVHRARRGRADGFGLRRSALSERTRTVGHIPHRAASGCAAGGL